MVETKTETKRRWFEKFQIRETLDENNEIIFVSQLVPFQGI